MAFVINKKNKHKPFKQVLEVKDEKVAQYVKDGFEQIDESPKEEVIATPDPGLVVEKPSSSWTEKKIKQWITDNGIPVDYNIPRDTKTEILTKLRDGGYL